MKEAKKQKKGLTIECQRDETEEQVMAMIDDDDQNFDEHKPMQKILVQAKKGQSHEEALAEFVTNSVNQCAPAADSFSALSFRRVDINLLIKGLRGQTDDLVSGDLESIEGILAVQAHTLNMIFSSLARLGADNIFDRFKVAEKLIRLALRAQSQSRATLDSLAAIKRPVFKQTNIAHGHQQVNNFSEKENTPNELLEQTDGERLDPGTPPEAVRVDSDLATVGKQHRAKNKRRKG